MALVQVRTPDREGTQPGLTAAAAETNGTTPRWQVVAASFAAIIAVWLLSIAINASFKPTALVIPAGISLFAMLYAVTQGLERLLEPVSSFFFSTTQHTENRNATLAAAVNLQTATDGELPTKLSELAKAARAAQDLQGEEPARQDPERVVKTLANVLQVPESEAPAVTRKAAVDLAAAAQAELDQRRADKAIAYWALASVLGLLVSGTLGLYLLHIVGLRGDGLATDGSWAGGLLSAAGIRHMLDLLVTGLAIGGGTKPLHDLISNLQAAKDNKKDPSQTR